MSEKLRKKGTIEWVYNHASTSVQSSHSVALEPMKGSGKTKKWPEFDSAPPKTKRHKNP